MRSRSTWDAVLVRATEGTRELQAATLAPGSPPIPAEAQLQLFGRVRAAIVRDGEPDWNEVQRLSVELLSLMRSGQGMGLPGADSTLMDMFQDQRSISGVDHDGKADP